VVRDRQHKAVLGNLRKIDTAIEHHKLTTGKFPASLDDISRPGVIGPSLHYVTGEDYRTVDVTGADLLRVRMPDGTEVVYTRTTGAWVKPTP
jgi:hypothetical protein